MRPVRLLLGAALLAGAALVVGTPHASAVTPASCALGGTMTFSKPVSPVPSESRFSLRVECHARAEAPARSSVAGYKLVYFNGSAPVDLCGAPAAGRGSVTGHPNQSPISGEFAFTKAPTGQYEMRGAYTRGARRFAVSISADAGGAVCNAASVKLKGTVQFQEVPAKPPAAGQMLATLSMTPGVTPNGAATQIVSLVGTVTGVWREDVSTCNAGFSGRSTAFETVASGQGVLSGSCTGPGFSQTCSMDYVRAGAVLSLVGECTGTQEGPFVATLVLATTGAAPMTTFTAAGPASFN